MKLIEWINGKTKLNKTTFDEFQDNIKEAVVPAGGTTGQVLAKNTDTDNDVHWIDPINGVTVTDTLTSTSTTDALSANQGKILNDKITNATTYSTEEINTGEKWIDGKTIYKKVIMAVGVTTSARLSDHTIAPGETLDTAWLDGGFAYFPDNKYQYPLDSNIGITVQISAYNNRCLYINDNAQGRTFNIYGIIKYTKAN